MSSHCLSDTEICHGTAVELHGRGLLILGRAGSGKSSLALELISRGARLVADDRVDIFMREQEVCLRAPHAISNLIEARGVGILHCPAAQAPLSLVVDLDREETERLPPNRTITCAGQIFPLIFGAQNLHLAAAMWVMAKYGRTS